MATQWQRLPNPYAVPPQSTWNNLPPGSPWQPSAYATQPVSQQLAPNPQAPPSLIPPSSHWQTGGAGPQPMYVPMQPPPPVQVTPLNPPQLVGEINPLPPAEPISPMAGGLYRALSQPGGEQIAQTVTSSAANALAGSTPPGFWSHMGDMASSPYFPMALALAGKIAATAARPESAGRQIADIGAKTVSGMSQIQQSQKEIEKTTQAAGASVSGLSQTPSSQQAQTPKEQQPIGKGSITKAAQTEKLKIAAQLLGLEGLFDD